MGGHDAGDFARHAIVDAVATIPNGLDPAARMHWVQNAIHRAHGLIRIETDRRGGGTIGATVVALILTNSIFVAFWAGDSRLYRLRDAQLQMLSVDHSVVAPLVEEGLVTWYEAELMPNSNVITRAVGVGEEIELSKIRGDVMAGDRYLICSDGLWR